MKTKQNDSIDKMVDEAGELVERLKSTRSNLKGPEHESLSIFEWLRQEIVDSNLTRKEREAIGDNLPESNQHFNETVRLEKYLTNSENDDLAKNIRAESPRMKNSIECKLISNQTTPTPLAPKYRLHAVEKTNVELNTEQSKNHNLRMDSKDRGVAEQVDDIARLNQIFTNLLATQSVGTNMLEKKECGTAAKSITDD